MVTLESMENEMSRDNEEGKQHLPFFFSGLTMMEVLHLHQEETEHLLLSIKVKSEPQLVPLKPNFLTCLLLITEER